MTSHRSHRPVSAQRARMIEDMTVRSFTEKRRNDYVRNARAFAAFIRRSPDTATAEDLRRLQLHQTQSGTQPPSINRAVAALHFFFTATLDRSDLARRLTVVREPRRLPAVLSVEGVTLLLQAAPGAKYRAALATAYGAGLRVSECCCGRAGQGPQRARRLAVAAAARAAARLAGRGPAPGRIAAAGLAFPGPQPDRAALVFHRHGAVWRRVNPGHLSLGQLQVMSAIERCRSAALGGHVERCEDCGHSRVAYNSCRNRPLSQVPGRGGEGWVVAAPQVWSTAVAPIRAPRDWLAAREADLLPVSYFPPRLHPAGRGRPDRLSEQGGGLQPAVRRSIRDIAHHRRRSRAPSAPPHDRGGRRDIARRHALGALQTRTRLPLASAGAVPSVPTALPVAARRCPTRRAGGRSSAISTTCANGRPSPHTSRHSEERTGSSTPSRPSAGLEAVLAYLARYTHHVAVSDSRVLGLDERGVTFRYKDYRRNGQARYRPMTLATNEFIRRFLLHVLPKAFHRIRHYGLLASATCKTNIARARELIAAPVRNPRQSTTTRTWKPAPRRTIARHAPVAAVE